MELKDTIEGMTSNDYKERFKAEYYQLKIRTDKLGVFIGRIFEAQARGTEEPKHDCPLTLLQLQHDRMCSYMDLLEKRALIEHIDLEN